MAGEKSTPDPQIWVITGGTRGVGLETARAVSARGDKAIVLARNGENGSEIAREGNGIAFLSCDVTDPASVAAAADDIRERWGHVDVLVNNAGLHRGGLIDALEQADWSAVLETNLGGPFNMVRAMLPLMSEGASIVNVGAVIGLRGFAGDAAYGASKAGLSGLTQVLAIELAPMGIRVNLVIPGFVSTDMTSGISDRARERIANKIPLGREGTAAEIADVIIWVAGSTYMTGAAIPTDGGLLCQL